MSTIPDDLRQLARELEAIQEASKECDNNPSYAKFKAWDNLWRKFDAEMLDDAIKIVSDAEERIVMLEGKPNKRLLDMLKRVVVAIDTDCNIFKVNENTQNALTAATNLLKEVDQ